MSRKMQAGQATAVPRDWPSMAAASATIRRSSRAIGRPEPGNYAVLSVVTPEPLDASAQELEAPTEFTAIARLEGQIVVTLSPRGTGGEPITLTIPVTAKVAGPKGLIPAGPAEE